MASRRRSFPFATRTTRYPRKDENHEASQTPIPGRSRGQPAAAGVAEGGAREAREGRDRRSGTQGGRGPRDRPRDQEAGGGGAASRHRRRVPPLLVAPRFSLGSRRRRTPRHG